MELSWSWSSAASCMKAAESSTDESGSANDQVDTGGIAAAVDPYETNNDNNQYLYAMNSVIIKDHRKHGDYANDELRKQHSNYTVTDNGEEFTSSSDRQYNVLREGTSATSCGGIQRGKNRRLRLLVLVVALSFAPITTTTSAATATTTTTFTSSTTRIVGRNGKLYRQHHPSFTAPVRPSHLPDIEYEYHPFDAHRHLYDDDNNVNDSYHKNAASFAKKQKNAKYGAFSKGEEQEKEDGSKTTTPPHDRRKAQSSSSSSSTTTTVLDPATDNLYQPLRVQFDTSELFQQMELALSAYDYLAATKLYLLMYEILPMTAEVWGDILRVIPVSGGIYPLAAKGSGKDQVLDNDNSNSNNNNGGYEEMEYSDDPVRAQYCPDETTSGIAGGADLLVYATVNRQCAGSTTTTTSSSSESEEDGGGGGGFMGTLASALSCQRDQYDRPITGSIDFCLEGMRNVVELNIEEYIAAKESAGIAIGNDHMVGRDINPTEQWNGWNGVTTTNDDGVDYLGGNRREVQYSVGVATHEIGHVLGVSSDSLSYFRHPLTGVPLTRRPFEVSTVTCINGESQAFVGMPGPAVLQEGFHGENGGRYFEVVTPTVRRVVQSHFNCRTMKGARLENQDTGSDCFGSHWDERLHYTEIMGAVFSPSVNILSPLTLSYLEDSGWYRANYESDFVHISTYGHGMGCDFVEKNCIDSDGNVPEAFQEQVCNTPITLSSSGMIDPSSSGAQTCDPSHTQKAYCDLIDTNELIAIGNQATTLEAAPEEYQYFKGQPNLRPYAFPNADYCPVPQLDPQSCLEYSGKYSISSEQEDAGETYGPNSRCVETDGTRSYTLCLETVCNTDQGLVQIMAGGTLRDCEYDGQVHDVLSDYDGGGDLRIKCPKAALVCPELFCPSNCAGRGECTYASNSGTDDAEYVEGVYFDDTTSTTSLAYCVCDSEEDTTAGCYETPLTFPAEYGYAAENAIQANKTFIIIIVGSLVVGLALMYVAIRQWKARKNVFM